MEGPRKRHPLSVGVISSGLHVGSLTPKGQGDKPVDEEPEPQDR